MYTISLTPDMQASALVLGCMRLTRLSGSQLDLHLKTALELGINFLTMRISTAAMAPASATLASGCAPILICARKC